MLLATVFQYRTLIGKCELGTGLEWEDIEIVTRIEHAFASHGRDGRRFRRQRVSLVGMMRGDQIHDRVDIIELAPGGLVCTNAPFVARGEPIELLIDDAEDSYRFVARGVWTRDDGRDFRVGLRFVGLPVRLHKVQISERTDDVIDQIAAA